MNVQPNVMITICVYRQRSNIGIALPFGYVCAFLLLVCVYDCV